MPFWIDLNRHVDLDAWVISFRLEKDLFKSGVSDVLDLVMASRIYRTGKAISHSGHFMREWRLASCPRCWAHAGREVGCERLNEKTLNSLICHSFPRAFDPGSRQFTHQRSNNELEVNFDFDLKQSEMHGFPYQNLYFDSDINTDLSRNSKLTFKIIPLYNKRNCSSSLELYHAGIPYAARV